MVHCKLLSEAKMNDLHIIRLENTDKFTIIDRKDLPIVLAISDRWFYQKDGYAYFEKWINGKLKKWFLHNLLVPYSDHANRNTLDNRRCNLRFATWSQNGINKPAPSNNTSGIKGVYFKKDRGKFLARITKDGKTYNLGYFTRASEAALAYNQKAQELFGDFAFLNKI